MKEKVALDKKSRKLLTKNLIILSALVIIAFVGMLAWFTSNPYASASGITVYCEAPPGLEIAVVGSGGTVTSDDYVTGKVVLDYAELENLILCEITGDGFTENMYKPVLTQADGIATPNTNEEWTKAEKNVDFISFDLYMRSTGTLDVYLDQTTSISPKSSTLTWAEGDDTTDCNPSEYGNFSKDCIVGAARLAILDATENNRKLLWIPAPNLKLTQSDGIFSVNTGLTEGDTYVHQYYGVTDDAKTQETIPQENVTTNNQGDYQLGEKKHIVKLETKIDDYYTEHVTFNIWIEGEDAEARRALVQGIFDVMINLTIR